MATNYIAELTCDPGSQNQFAIANTYVIQGFTPGEWSGTSGNLVYFYSDTPGSQVTIDISAITTIYVSYASFQDINFVGGTVYTNSTCVNLGDNSGIVSISPYVPPQIFFPWGNRSQDVTKPSYFTPNPNPIITIFTNPRDGERVASEALYLDN